MRKSSRASWPHRNREWSRARHGESILRPLTTQARLFVPCKHPILAHPNPESQRCLQVQCDIFLYRFSAVFWVASLPGLSTPNRRCLQVGGTVPVTRLNRTRREAQSSTHFIHSCGIKLGQAFRIAVEIHHRFVQVYLRTGTSCRLPHSERFPMARRELVEGDRRNCDCG
jgi:hypothetical protein